MPAVSPHCVRRCKCMIETGWLALVAMLLCGGLSATFPSFHHCRLPSAMHVPCDLEVTIGLQVRHGCISSNTQINSKQQALTNTGVQRKPRRMKRISPVCWASIGTDCVCLLSWSEHHKHHNHNHNPKPEAYQRLSSFHTFCVLHFISSTSSTT